MLIKQKTSNFIYGSAIFLCFMPFISPAIALIIGILFSIFGIRRDDLSKYTSKALQGSIILMGFGMNLTQVIQTSKTGFMITAVSVIFTITTGLIIGKFLKVDKKTSMLIASGTAICGGSAIAAVAPVINAKSNQISFALIVIFTLNAIALLIFPAIGHYFNLSQKIFGYWAAIAIHDTSSVVGAGASYGSQALQVATTVKLARALWIIPLTIGFAIFNKDTKKDKIKIPWFIGLFVVAIIVAHFLPQFQSTFVHLNWLGKKGMVIALLLIGANLSIPEMKKAGFNSFMLGILLWIIIGSLSFYTFITYF